MSTTTTLAGGNFLIPDATFLAEIVAFVIILVVMYKFVVPPLQKSVSVRQEMIRKQIEDSKEAKERLDAAESEYKAMISEARAEAAKAREEGQRIRQETIDSAKEQARIEAEAVTARAEARLEAERAQVLNQLRGEIGRLSVELAERIVGESLSDDERQRRVVDRFLAEMENAPAAATQAAAAAGESR
ncbi:MAG: F0F1 ATP synthase subunit B [Mycobacteriales bacterium]